MSGNLLYLIEYDGEFHYQDIFKDGSFEILQSHDKYKNDYCKRIDIKLIRIPYWKYDNIKTILKEVLNEPI